MDTRFFPISVTSLKAEFGFPRNARAEFSLLFPDTRSCVFLSEGRRWLPISICFS